MDVILAHKAHEAMKRFIGRLAVHQTLTRHFTA
jgi:hypothetical protein